MQKSESIKKIVYNAIDTINDELPKNQIIKKNLDFTLYGSQDSLDSLGLVNLVVMIEQKIEDEMGFPINLTDDKAMSQKTSPFRTVGTLVDYITSSVEANKHEK